MMNQEVTQDVIIRTRNADRSQNAILVAARSEFAEVGLGGARMDNIAKRCNLNKRLIYYYFKDKENLFQSVLEQAYKHIREQEQTLNLAELDPLEAIQLLVRFTWTYYLDHPEFIALLNSANLHRARHLEGATDTRALNSALIEMLDKILQRGAQEGQLKSGIDATQLYISIAGLSYFYLSNRYTLSAIFGTDLQQQSALAQRLEHMIGVVESYVKK